MDLSFPGSSILRYGDDQRAHVGASGFEVVGMGGDIARCVAFDRTLGSANPSAVAINGAGEDGFKLHLDETGKVRASGVGRDKNVRWRERPQLGDHPRAVSLVGVIDPGWLVPRFAVAGYLADPNHQVHEQYKTQVKAWAMPESNNVNFCWLDRLIDCCHSILLCLFLTNQLR